MLGEATQTADGSDESVEDPLDGDPPTSGTPAWLDPNRYPRGEKRPLNHGTKIRAKVKRGEGTRDQDELLIEGRGENAEEAAADFEAALSYAESRGWTDRLRDLQPDGEDDDDV